MKLYRFTAADNHRAIVEVHEALGPDAMIYTTRKTMNGVEILAGLPHNHKGTVAKGHEVGVQDGASNQQMIEKMNNQIQLLNDNVKQLTGMVVNLQQALEESLRKKKWVNWPIIANTLKIKKYFKRRVVYGQTVL